ncbi:nucleic-acid-binding protein from transposon X-element [Trichonephila clavata]|uniref:Nucleic-acid-binding protein from transposon X-element n=1 Tax=Trichonephila clavata TaxID=2740835 RepID=A0A8X6HP13_TRICU|nr:nucleic-acid-binding protein from transposon X-element [Trichonephila clavata]
MCDAKKMGEGVGWMRSCGWGPFSSPVSSPASSFVIATFRMDSLSYLPSARVYALTPISLCPQKIVIKGLPISTEVEDIKNELVTKGFRVEKVAQLTKSKTKFKLRIFMVELKKSPDSLDIFQLKTCCYLAIKVDNFNRRPGPTQFYNCNLFNHSSKNCHVKTRCLKCGQQHRTGECPIKDKIENPTCINCGEKGHLANSHRCAKFPKPQPKKEDASQNRNLNKNLNTTAVNDHKIITSAQTRNNLSYANVIKGPQQMAPLDTSKSVPSRPETLVPREAENKNKKTDNNEEKPFGFIDTIIEIRQLFAEYPFLMDLGRQLRNAVGPEKVDVFYRHISTFV